MERAQFIKFCTPMLRRNQDIQLELDRDSSYERPVLPPGTSWLVIHPHWRCTMWWQGLMRLVALYYFLDVPFRIAFQGLHCHQKQWCAPPA